MCSGHDRTHVRCSKQGKERTQRTLLPVEAMVVESDVLGVAAADVLLHRPYDLAEPPVTA
jgi:hypothetical protein